MAAPAMAGCFPMSGAGVPLTPGVGAAPSNRTSGILAIPGYGYVFEMDGGDGFKRYGAVRVTHVGQTLLILDWAFQTDPGNPELIVTKK